MNKLLSAGSKSIQKLLFLIISAALLMGVFLSFLSWLEICVEHCSANKDYRLLGFPFAYIGIAFFTGLLTVHLFSYFYTKLSRLMSWMLAAGIGSEAFFIGVQKYQIGHWCPVCLSIAATLLIATIIFFGNQYINNFNVRNSMLKKTFEFFSFAFIGFIIAFVGVSKVDPLEANIDTMREKLEFGNKSSPIEAYFITDWFCPSCKKVEPVIEKLLPRIEPKVGFFFIDLPIHTKSMNYSPYNLAFLINDKPQYFAARKMIMKMTNETEDPTDEDIAAAAKKQGLRFKELSYLNIKSGMATFNKIIEKYKLDATPTLIIANIKTNKFTKLEGTNEITEEAVMKAINNLEKS